MFYSLWYKTYENRKIKVQIVKKDTIFQEWFSSSSEVTNPNMGLCENCLKLFNSRNGKAFVVFKGRF